MNERVQIGCVFKRRVVIFTDMCALWLSCVFRHLYFAQVVRDAVVRGDAYPVPVGIFVGGAPCGRIRDHWPHGVRDVLTGLRHVVVALTKETFCFCGCRALCSLHRVLGFLLCFSDAPDFFLSQTTSWRVIMGSRGSQRIGWCRR